MPGPKGRPRLLCNRCNPCNLWIVSLRARTLFITGASRGIGHAIAVRAAEDGANVVIVAKTTEPHPKLPGTIYTAAADVEAAGGKALAVPTDIRDEAQVDAAIAAAVERFGGIDIVVNNASAISLTNTMATPMKRFDLMHQINTRGTFLCTQRAIPHLERSSNPHVLNIAPPLHSTLSPRWFGPHVAYTMAKYGMSLCVLGMAEEFRPIGIAVNALWPRTAIDTEAIRLISGQDARARTRSPRIMADAAYWILTQPSRAVTGRFFLDDETLRGSGVTDFSRYRQPAVTEEELMPDFFL
jgi:citronellol/citronellal dehydrogenase